MSFFEIFDGAQEGTWTLTPFGIRTSSVHVYHSITWAFFWNTISSNWTTSMVHPVGFEPTTNGFEDRYSSNWAMDACSLIWISRRIIEMLRENANLFLLFCLSFAKSVLFPILTPMQAIQVKICTGRSCSERHSEYIRKRLDADREFYQYKDDELILETCLCQWRCKEGPTLIFGKDVQIWQNPVKASELLRKKIMEARKRFAPKK